MEYQPGFPSLNIYAWLSSLFFIKLQSDNLDTNYDFDPDLVSSKPFSPVSPRLWFKSCQATNLIPIFSIAISVSKMSMLESLIWLLRLPPTSSERLLHIIIFRWYNTNSRPLILLRGNLLEALMIHNTRCVQRQEKNSDSHIIYFSSVKGSMLWRIQVINQTYGCLLSVVIVLWSLIWAHRHWGQITKEFSLLALLQNQLNNTSLHWQLWVVRMVSNYVAVRKCLQISCY